MIRRGVALTGGVALLVAVFTADAGAASPAPLRATQGLVVSASPAASLVGAQVLQRGGNAADAAIATHFALAVTYPQAGNMGGGGFLLIRTADGACEAIDFRETAPALATREMYLSVDGRPDPQLSTWTLLGTGVPGSVAGMALAHERHSTLPWRELLAPAILLAEGGFVLDSYTADHLAQHADRLGNHADSRRIFLRGDSLWHPGDLCRQPDLARTLRRLAEQGPREFYEGETAELLVAEMERGGGLITSEDLRGYRPRIREPLRADYRGYTVYSMPPPSSGGIALLQMLGMLEPFPLTAYGPLGSRTCHLLVEVMRRAFADRAEFLGDPDFSPVPVAGLLDPAYIDSLRQQISLLNASSSDITGPGIPSGAEAFYAVTGGTPGADTLPPEGGPETTHFSIVDAEGNAVAVTTTLNTSYGTGITVTGAGFLLNNEMDDFASAPGQPNYYGLIQGEANAVRPFGRPLSSMTPTIGTREGELAFLLGSPGGPRIITSVLQALINMVDFGMNIQEAIDAPRVHHQWQPDTLFFEAWGLSADVQVALEEMGHELATRAPIGSVQGIRVEHDEKGSRLLFGAGDPRRNGCAVGVHRGEIVSRCAPCDRR